MGQVYNIQQTVNDVFSVFIGNLISSRIKIHIFRYFQVIVHAEKVRHISNLCPQQSGIFCHIHIIHPDTAFCCLQKSCHNALGGGLSGAVWPYKAINAAVRHGQCQMIHCRKIAVAFHQFFHFKHTDRLLSHAFWVHGYTHLVPDTF